MSSQRLSKDCCGNEYYELVESPEQRLWILLHSLLIMNWNEWLFFQDHELEIFFNICTLTYQRNCMIKFLMSNVGSISTYGKFSEKLTFFTTCYAHVCNFGYLLNEWPLSMNAIFAIIMAKKNLMFGRLLYTPMHLP